MSATSAIRFTGKRTKSLKARLQIGDRGALLRDRLVAARDLGSLILGGQLDLVAHFGSDEVARGELLNQHAQRGDLTGEELGIGEVPLRLLAILLGLVPLPEVLQPLRPYWLALVVAYWVIEDNERLGLVFAFSMGLLADLAFGSILGEQALRLTVMAFILQRFRTQLRFFPMAQQALAIGGLLFNDRVVSAAIHLALGVEQVPWTYWLAPVVGMMLWAPLYLVMDALRFSRRGR